MCTSTQGCRFMTVLQRKLTLLIPPGLNEAAKGRDRALECLNTLDRETYNVKKGLENPDLLFLLEESAVTFCLALHSAVLAMKKSGPEFGENDIAELEGLAWKAAEKYLDEGHPCRNFLLGFRGTGMGKRWGRDGFIIRILNERLSFQNNFLKLSGVIVIVTKRWILTSKFSTATKYWLVSKKLPQFRSHGRCPGASGNASSRISPKTIKA
jgi:hypothetical protein